eukprot:11605230-Alexandrium_andersonii.AAC.1
MSASLVGSEMCIRDRPYRSPVRSLRSCREGRKGEAVALRPRLFQLHPVSYTHLTLPTICSV